MGLKLNTASSGSVTIEPTNTASNYTLTVPAQTGTVVATDASGNVGIGVTPSAWSGFAGLDIGTGGLGFYSAGMQQNAYYNGSNWTYKTTNVAAQYLQSGGQHRWYTAPSGTAGNAITFTQAMTLDASGNFYLGTTAANPIVSGVVGFKYFPSIGVAQVNGNNVPPLEIGRFGGTGTLVAFYYAVSGVGSISTNGTSTSYNTSSDYRLKDNQAPLTGSGAFIDALQPKTWTWTADGSTGVGFIAHEVQEVSPNSVVGEKDAVETYVDEDGVEQTRPKYQAMEYGSAEFIANIIAELQDLRKRVAVLENK